MTNGRKVGRRVAEGGMCSFVAAKRTPMARAPALPCLPLAPAPADCRRSQWGVPLPKSVLSSACAAQHCRSVVGLGGDETSI